MGESIDQNATGLAVVEDPTCEHLSPEEQPKPLSALRQRLEYVFSSPGVLLKELQSVGYITDPVVAFTVWLAYKNDKPIIQEGPAGAGKTQLAVSVAQVTGMRIVRLQCYPGITDDKAIGRYNEALQRIFSQILNSKDVNIDDINREISSRKFFITGPLLEAIESEDPCILLIDEVDKVPHEFEAMLLELLSVWELSAPGMGTIKAKSIPLTFITSNAERDLADPLRRRSFYLEIKHPTALLEAQIVSYKTSTLPVETHVFIAGLMQSLRAYPMKKHPSISEMTDIARSMEMLGLTKIRPEHQEVILPLLAKRKEDIKKLRLRDQFTSIVLQANDYLLLVKLKIAANRGELTKEYIRCPIDKAIDKLRRDPVLLRTIEAVEISIFPEREIKQIEAEKLSVEEKRRG